MLPDCEAWSALSVLPHPILAVDAARQTILAANPAAEVLYGQPSAMLAGRAFATLRDAVGWGAAGDGVERHRCSDGTTRYVQVRRSETCLCSRSVHLLTLTDVTPSWAPGGRGARRCSEHGCAAEQLVKVQQALKASEETFRSLVELSFDAIFLETVRGEILACNPSACAMFGYTEEEMRTLRIHDLVPDDFAAALPDVIEVDTGGLALERVNKRKDGTLFPTEVSTRLLTVGGERRLIAYIRDITERKEAEEALRQSEERWRWLVEHSPVPLIVNVEDQIAYVNPAGAQLLEADDPDELVGHRIPDLILPEDHPLYWRFRGMMARGEGPPRAQVYRIRGLRGSERAVEAFSVPMAHEGRSATLIVAVDVTARQAYERKLVQARDHAEELGRLKDAFLANVSHEVRTPLTSILGFAQILESEVSETGREFVELTRVSAERLMNTLNSVLNLGELERGEMSLCLERVDVAARAREALALQRPRVHGRDVTLHCDAPDEGLFANLDRGALDRVLMNLLSNAVKFTVEGHVRVTVRSDGDAVVVRVADTGIGMSPEFLPHVYDEFRQESTGHAREYEGSGLGLAISRRLVEGMGGRIEVDSDKGRGTVFTVTLPRDGVEAERGNERAERGAPA